MSDANPTKSSQMWNKTINKWQEGKRLLMEMCTNTNQHMKELYCEKYWIQFFTPAEHTRAASWPSYSFPHFHSFKLFAVDSNFTDFYWFSTLLVTSHFLYAPLLRQCSFGPCPPNTSRFIFPSVSAFSPTHTHVDMDLHTHIHTRRHVHAKHTKVFLT